MAFFLGVGGLAGGRLEFIFCPRVPVTPVNSGRAALFNAGRPDPLKFSPPSSAVNGNFWPVDDLFIPGMIRSASRGVAGQGMARRGRSGLGGARQGVARPGMAGLGEASQGTARRGEARPGRARLGVAGRGLARHGKAWLG